MIKVQSRQRQRFHRATTKEKKAREAEVRDTSGPHTAPRPTRLHPPAPLHSIPPVLAEYLAAAGPTVTTAAAAAATTTITTDTTTATTATTSSSK